MSHPKIGLSLSGGGARGIAHVGLLQALIEEGLAPSRITGTSAGAIVGVLYAAGLSVEQIMDFVRHSSVFKLIKVGIPLMGLTKLDYLRGQLTTLLPVKTFEELNIPLQIGITNLNTGKLEIRSSGPLIEVIVAACSIPFVFKPVEMDGNLYVDGGVMNNLPLGDLCVETDFVIGSNLIPHTEIPAGELNNVVTVMARVFDLSIRYNSQPSADCCDFMFEPTELMKYQVYHLHKWQELYDLGYLEARKLMPQLRRKLAKKMAAQRRREAI